MSLVILFALLFDWLRAAPRCSSFAPIQQFIDPRRSLRLPSNSKPHLPHCGLSSCVISTIHREQHSFLQAAEAAAVVASDERTKSEISQKEFSYAAILKVIDESHYQQATESCTYLSSEKLTSDNESRVESIHDDVLVYLSPAAPILSDDAVNELRIVAQKYFVEKGRGNNRTSTIDRVQLEDLLPIDVEWDPEWRRQLESALMHDIYPSIRSHWLRYHDENEGQRNSGNKSKSNASRFSSVLTVVSASVFAGGMFTGAQAGLTTLERDAGMFVVHIDLGNDGHIGKESELPVMGALYIESLLKKEESQSNESIVGPLVSGQMIVHKSSERTAAIVVPSNIHDVVVNSETSTLDCISRTQILRAAERARHFVLRLVLTTKKCTDVDDGDTTKRKDITEAPLEERSYRLRNYARFSGEGRVRYLTLAGLLDLSDYENHLWLGFDYISRIENPEYQFDLCQRLSDVNKAVFHLETASKLCPTDSRVFFQLATALGAKMECEMRLRLEEGDVHNFLTESDKASNLLKMADALERSAFLESAAVKAGVNGVQDLAICLNVLAETWCKAGEFDKALGALDRWAECGSVRSALSIEDTSAQLQINSCRYEWIMATDDFGKTRHIALKTVGDTPLFESSDINILRAAADKRFALAAGVQTSRYTMQYEGNSEVHLDDLCAGDPLLMMRINQILQTKVYPLVREAFTELGCSDGDTPPSGPLCVYDSIFVRYNGDKAKAAGRDGASQPLHQDGGIYSINIALNDARLDDAQNSFTGGGTFFEALTLQENIQRPISPGHAIIHKTSQRHAGAPTTSGVRDILVIFLTAQRPRNAGDDDNIWKIERAMRLQSIAVGLEREKRIRALQLASDNDPTNSEVPYWLGVHLIQGDMNDVSDERWEEICTGLESLMHSISLNPADARAHYHLGMAISTRHKYAIRTRRTHLLPPAQEAAESLIHTFETAISLEKKCDKAGCKNGINLAAALFSLGDFMARLKNFDMAISYLNRVEGSIESSGDTDKEWAYSIRQEVSSMLDFCKREASAKIEA